MRHKERVGGQRERARQMVGRERKIAVGQRDGKHRETDMEKETKMEIKRGDQEEKEKQK